MKKKVVKKKEVKVKKKPEELFEEQLIENGIDYVTQYKFHPTRKWRFDFAIHTYSVAVEVMGGVWIRGGHVTGAGFTKDSEKLNEAQILGWSVLYITSSMVRDGSGINYLKRLLEK